MAKRRGGAKTAHGLMKGGRPFGSNSNSGKGLMTSETRTFGSNASMSVRGKPARSNGVKNLAGRATKNWSADPNRKRIKN